MDSWTVSPCEPGAEIVHTVNRLLDCIMMCNSWSVSVRIFGS